MFPALVVIAALLHPAVLFAVIVALAGVAKLKALAALVISAIGSALAAAPLFGTTVAYPGYGSSLANGGTSGGSYTNLGQIKKFDFNGLKAEFDDITNLSSPSIFKEWMKTVVDGDTVTFSGVFNPADPTEEALLTNIATSGSAALDYWKITLTDGSTLVFQAYVSEFKTGVQYDKAITFSGSLKLVGNVTASWS